MAVEVYYFYIPNPWTFTPSNFKIVFKFLGTGITCNGTKGDIYAQNSHEVGYLWLAPLS